MTDTQRAWRLAPAAPTFIVAHFNVLADELCVPGDFEGVDADTMKWETRRERLLDVITAARPDILSLVECDHYADFWQPRLAALGFAAAGYAVKHADGRKTHGVALFMRRGGPFKIHCAPLTLTSGVACVITGFEHTAEPRAYITVVATHLKAKAAEVERATQMNAIHDAVQGIGPLIVVGDFNALTTEPGINLTMHELGLVHANPMAWTTWKRRTGKEEVKRSIDHVYADRSLHPVRYLDVPDNIATPLPGAHYPSDHLLVAVEFALR